MTAFLTMASICSLENQPKEEPIEEVCHSLLRVWEALPWNWLWLWVQPPTSPSQSLSYPVRHVSQMHTSS